MRYSPGHKEATRERLLNLSSAISKERGFDSMSVDTLMAAAGLTGGAFYAHFKSKEELFVEVIGRELARSLEMLSPEEGQTPVEWLSKIFDNYLNTGHVRHPESGCVVPSLGPEIARAEPEVKKLYEAAMIAVKERWTEVVVDPNVAWAVICQLIGTIVVARAMSSRRVMEEIVNASRMQLERTIATSPEVLQHANTDEPSKKRRTRKT
jgi:TetR/AcrR family transcriptional repressor of nem operon